ncbi:MAG: hypothetical protein PVG65_01165 [Candidatus Thorarchaeota archaeon]|jgi:hypothetical protein
MIKIFMSVRNRLAITQKVIEAIRRNTSTKYQLYVYNNNTTYLVNEHFEYFCDLYKKKEITQVSFTTDASTFNAFSKASTCNFFGLQHQQDPNKEKYDFLVMMDNDIILLPGWDKRVKIAWDFIKKKGDKWNHIKLVGQLPGGIKQKNKELINIPGLEAARTGKLGGSGLWCVKPNFFKDVGLINLARLVGRSKMHDQLYWRLLEKASGGKHYILGIKPKLGIHCGAIAGSVCNRLERNRRKPAKHKELLIEFQDQEETIGNLDFDTFYKRITTAKKYERMRGW